MDESFINYLSYLWTSLLLYICIISLIYGGVLYILSYIYLADLMWFLVYLWRSLAHITTLKYLWIDSVSYLWRSFDRLFHICMGESFTDSHICGGVLYILFCICMGKTFADFHTFMEESCTDYLTHIF